MRKGGNPDIAKYGFKPGQSGNPAGRPKTPEEVRAAFQAATPKALEVLLEVMANGKSEQTRVKAAEVVLDRAYGKAAAQVNVNVTDVGAVHLQLLEEIRARRQERLGQVVDVTPSHTDKVSEYDPPKSNE